MAWWLTASVLFGVFTALLRPRAAGGLRLPRHQRGGRVGVAGRGSGAGPDDPERRGVHRQLLAHAHPVLHPDGRGSLPHRGGPEGHRRDRPGHRAGAGPALRGRRRGGDGVLGHLGIDDRHHRAARQSPAARDAAARLPSPAGHGAHHGHRRGRHADPAVRAHRAPGQPQRDLDLAAPRGGNRARRRALSGLRGLHRGPGRARSAPGARLRPRAGDAGGRAGSRWSCTSLPWS